MNTATFIMSALSLAASVTTLVVVVIGMKKAQTAVDDAIHIALTKKEAFKKALGDL